MLRTLTLLIAGATAVATVDLVQKALSISERDGAVFAHDRSAGYVAGIAVVAVVWAGIVSLTGSASISLTAGLVLGGAVGNLTSIALWPSVPGVPDPLVAGNIAFNLADVSVGLGVLLLVPTTLVYAVRNRERLFEPA